MDLSGCRNLSSLPDDIRVRSWIDVADTGLRQLPWSLRSTRIRWHGAPIDDRLAFDPGSITAEEIVHERNLMMRQLLLERMGIERFIRSTGAEVVDRDYDAGGERQLLRIRFEAGEDLFCLVVHCPSTSKRYILRVPPEMHTCQQAVAWTAGFGDPTEYQPIIET